MEPLKICFDRRFVLHGRDVDLGPRLQDGQLLECQRTLVVDDGRLAKRVMTVGHLRVELAQRRHEELVKDRSGLVVSRRQNNILISE